MSKGPRQTGGQNNKRGNRYEDVFATYKLLQGIPDYLDYARNLRLKEQVPEPIDDLLVETPDVDYYHQLKSDQQTTWGQKGGKLEREFRDQKATCIARKKKYELIIVVPNEARRKSLGNNIPEGLKSVTKVLVFPPVTKPSELVRQKELVGSLLTDLSASTLYGESEHQIIANTVYAAWIDHAPDKDGFCNLDRLMATIRKSYESCRIRTDWKRKPINWKAAQTVLNQIPGFTWTVERGYFEWRYPPGNQGLMSCRCQSENFNRFIERVVETRPTNFDDLWAQFP